VGTDRLGLSDDDLALVADALAVEAPELRADLDRRPWSILDLLEHPEVVTAVLEPVDPIRSGVSPLLFFAVLAQQAAADLRTTAYVNEWAGPRQRLPVFDVEPLREFTEAPARVLFIAHLLAAFTHPVELPAPVNAFDLEEIAGWIEFSAPQDRVTLLRHLGDLALFRAGVLADETGPRALDVASADRLLRSLHLTSDDEAALRDPLCDPGTFAPGIEAMESLGPTWYRAATEADDRGRVSAVVSDVATRFRPARRFLNHLADRYLDPGSVTVGFT
jgi:hypothetical protein